MANETRQIRIESILGGHGPSTHFSASNQFLTSLGIDPSLYTFGTGNSYIPPSGLLRPSPSLQISSGVTRAPRFIRGAPGANSSTNWFVYDSVNSVYTIDSSLSTITGLADLNDGFSSDGSGMEYYDNYMYFARLTTIARYGPFTSASPTMTKDYWGNTLGKTALTGTNYPYSGTTGSEVYPQHVLHRHSDGKLYIADVVDNIGTIHYIKTKKTTVEGDTDDGSTYDKVHVGYKLLPMNMESYGENLVIGFIDRNFSNVGSEYGGNDTALNAKIAFWDTTSQNVNQITWVEFPDPIVSAIKNINGVLYFFSGPAGGKNGFRVMRYIGGSSFEEVFSTEQGFPPAPGAVDGYSERLFFGSSNNTPRGSITGSLFSIGLKKKELGNGIFNVQSITQSTTTAYVSAFRIDKSDSIGTEKTITGWYDEFLNVPGIDTKGSLTSTSGYGNSVNRWFSQIFKIGQPFKIKKIRIPLAQVLTSSMSVEPYIWLDGLTETKTLSVINSANYGTSRKSVVIRPENLTGENDFCLELNWTGTECCTISLPITIEYELLDVDSTKAS